MLGRTISLVTDVFCLRTTIRLLHKLLLECDNDSFTLMNYLETYEEDIKNCLFEMS